MENTKPEGGSTTENIKTKLARILNIFFFYKSRRKQTKLTKNKAKLYDTSSTEKVKKPSLQN
jgi:hypothetical protein